MKLLKLRADDDDDDDEDLKLLLLLSLFETKDSCLKILTGRTAAFGERDCSIVVLRAVFVIVLNLYTGSIFFFCGKFGVIAGPGCKLRRRSYLRMRQVVSIIPCAPLLLRSFFVNVIRFLGHL